MMALCLKNKTIGLNGTGKLLLVCYYPGLKHSFNGYLSPDNKGVFFSNGCFGFHAHVQ
jgi:hypothetical protein